MHQGPMEALSEHYAQAAPICADDRLLNDVYVGSRKKKQRVTSAVYGFGFGACAAILLIVWAARPSSTHQDATANAIARYQMINSGLVENHAHDRSEVAR